MEWKHRIVEFKFTTDQQEFLAEISEVRRRREFIYTFGKDFLATRGVTLGFRRDDKTIYHTFCFYGVDLVVCETVTNREPEMEPVHWARLDIDSKPFLYTPRQTGSVRDAPWWLGGQLKQYQEFCLNRFEILTFWQKLKLSIKCPYWRKIWLRK